MSIIQIEGIVVQGQKKATALGYPTANLVYKERPNLESGVWTCYAQFNGITKPGLAVIGMWTEPHGLPSVEVHLIDFSGDLYGQEITIGLQEKLRGLQSFPSNEALIEAIKHDIEEARKRFV